MRNIKTLLAAAIAALAAATHARAADVPGSWFPPLGTPSGPRATELLSGWYLRGDVGYRFNRVGSVDASNPPGSGPTVLEQKYGDAVGITGGLGYKYEWLRGDLTLDYGTLKTIRATTATAASQPQYSDRIDVFAGLANLYFDLGTWGGITPYVGGGLGASYVRSREYVNTALPASAAAESAKQLNFAWAWMAGISVRVQHNWLVDVGYRHLDLGEAVSRAMLSGGSVDVTTWKRLRADEVRVGIRFLFD